MADMAGAQISRRAFAQSLAILLALMMIAAIATRIVAPGRYERLTVGGREVVDPTSYSPIDRPDYPVWR